MPYSEFGGGEHTKKQSTRIQPTIYHRRLSGIGAACLGLLPFSRLCSDGGGLEKGLLMNASKAAKAAESVIERVQRAVSSLATGIGDVRSRLCIVGQILIPLQGHEFPEELGKDFESIMEDLTLHPSLHDEGRIVATMNRIQDLKGEEIASRVWGLYLSLQEIRSLG